MVSISPSTFPSPSSTRSDPNSYKFTLQNTRIASRLKRSSYSLFRSHYLSKKSDSTLCLCHSNKNDSDNSFSWDSAIREAVSNAVKWFDYNASSYRGGSKDVTKSVGVLERSEDVDSDDEEWDWDRWRKHFDEVDEQQLVVSVLKSQLAHAVSVEEFEDASNLKVAIAAAATNDTVGRVMSHLKRAIKEEHYRDAAFVRDYAGAGLVGWWAGIAEDTNDPYGHIIRISAEHGRYVARSYSSRQLATASAGIPLFEIYLIINKKGEYKHQVVYLRRLEVRDFSVVSSESLDPTGSLNPLDSTANKTYPEDSEDRDADSIIADGLPVFDNVLRDMLPGVKFKVLNVAALENVDQDLISKVIEKMNDHGVELGSVDIEDDNGEGDQVQKEPEINGRDGILDEERGEIVVTCITDGLVQKVFNSASNKHLIRVPATLEKKGRLSFSFSVGNDESQQVPKVKGQTLRNKKAKHGIHHVMYDLSKFKGRGKIPIKVLKDIVELITFTLSRAQNRPLLSGSTTFNRIQIPASPDPLNGLYIGAGGIYSSEVIQLRRKVGQWEEDGGTEEPLNPEFYEYVEAVKITGDPYVPAGQAAFRAKVGKKYMLPHKGIIPEEFGVIARYKGEGRLAEPGFLNPRWVDGELVILDGKLSKRGPVVMFMYASPEYHFSVFFNRLRLQE